MSVIKKISRKNLNLDKYSETLKNCTNYRLYAEVWFLDVMTDQKWECLVYGDYEVLMPIPLQYKFGIKFVLQPFYCQQLGVFYKHDISEKLFKEFENKLHSYRVRAYNFNEENTETYQPEGTEGVNYIIDLNKTYDELSSKFRKDRRRDIRKNTDLGLKISNEFNPKIFLDIFKTEYKTLSKISDIHLIQKFITALVENKSLVTYTLHNTENEVIAISVFTKSINRIFLQFSVRNRTIEPKGSYAFMMSEIIRDFSEKQLILDFEGSSVKGIADFKISFGAERKTYTKYRNFNF